MAKVARGKKAISVADSCHASNTWDLVEDRWTGALSLISKQGASTGEFDALQSPNAMTVLDVASPKSRITSILDHVAEKGHLFGEEDELVNEVRA